MSPPSIPEVVNPASVHVVAVGIEAYDNESFLPLKGVAGQAIRFARWALEGGVPPGQVTVAVNRAEGGKAAEVEALAVEAATVVTADYTTLANLIATAHQTPGELLLLYWAGHGVLNERGERVVFSADTTAQIHQFLSVDSIRLHLRAPSACRRQVMFFDACANFVRDTGLRGQLRNDFSEGGDQSVRQSTLFSAAQGAYAEQGAIETRTTFSGILLDWLPSQTLLIDIDSAYQHIADRLEEVKADPATREFPVRHVLESPSQVREFGEVPVSGLEKQALDRVELSVAQVREIKQSANDIGLDEDDSDDLLLSALEGGSGAHPLKHPESGCRGHRRGPRATTACGDKSRTRPGRRAAIP